VVAKATPARTLLAVLRAAGAGHVRPTLDARALRTAGERLDPDDLPILGMLAHGVPAEEIAQTLGVEPDWLVARRWAMLAKLAGRTHRRPPVAA
jgi:hypothetical protein